MKHSALRQNSSLLPRGPAAALLFLPCTAAARAQTVWEAGVADPMITSAQPVWMYGYSSRNRPFEKVRQDIHLKALALWTENGKPAVLITADLGDFPRDVSALIAEKCLRKFGLERDRLVLNASHTHSGPVISLSEILGSYELNEVQTEAVRQYTRWLVDRAVDTIGESIRKLAIRKRSRVVTGIPSIFKSKNS